jgi:hypothetical protein
MSRSEGRSRTDGENHASAVALRLMDSMDRWSSSDGDVQETSVVLPSFEAVGNERPECAFDGCTAGWSKRWKRRARPVFEGGWGCSEACVRALVEASVRREMEGADGADVAEEHQHRVPLGLVLLAQGLVTQAQLRLALDAQKAAGRGRIGEWLVEAGGVSETKITRGLGMQWQCPVLGLSGFDGTRMALAMPAVLRELCKAAPLRVAGGRILYLAFDENVDAAAAFALERMSALRVDSGVMPSAEFARAVRTLDGCSAVECRTFEVADRGEMVDRIVEALRKLQPVASKIVRLRDRYWMRLWLERGAFGKNGMLPATEEDVIDLVMRIARK